MKKLLVASVVLLALWGCGKPYDGDAKIVYHKYVPGRNEWVPGYTIWGSCSGGYGSIPRRCSPDIHVPGHDEWRPEQFTIRVEWTTDKGKVKRETRSVPQTAYDDCPDGRTINLKSMKCPLR